MRLILIYIYLSSISKLSQEEINIRNTNEIICSFPLSSLCNSVCFLHLQHASLWGSPGWLVAAVLACSYKGSFSLVGFTSVHTHGSPPLEMEGVHPVARYPSLWLWVYSPPCNSGILFQLFPVVASAAPHISSLHAQITAILETFLVSHIDLVSPALYKKPI